MIFDVEVSERAWRNMRKIPQQIVDRLLEWAAAVQKDGLEAVRRRPGLHDEPLRGDLVGLRSIRLNRAYRAYYRILNGTAEFVSVERVGKHED